MGVAKAALETSVKYLNIELKPNKNYEELNVKNILKEINRIRGRNYKL